MHISILKNAAVAELADAQDLKSCGTYTPVPVRFRSAAVVKIRETLILSVSLIFMYQKSDYTRILYTVLHMLFIYKCCPDIPLAFFQQLL